MKKIFIIASLLLMTLAGMAQEKQPLYKSSFFGIRSDGTTDNTTSIQKAIDFIAGKGGGTLEFSVGRYLTGAVELKSGVDISLRGCQGCLLGRGRLRRSHLRQGRH